MQAYDSVCANLELSREYVQQIAQVVTENSRLQKKQLRKKEQEKQHEELEKVKEILRVQVSVDIFKFYFIGNKKNLKNNV